MLSSTLVWYVSYGSNLLRERFLLYITGGHLKEYARDHRGCPDKTLPVKDVALEIPGELFFASHNQWGGMAAAFVDIKGQGVTKARAYLITLDQFEHILAQESNILEPVAVDLVRLKEHGSLQIGDGADFFNELAYLGDRDGYPLITFTNSGEQVAPAPPSQAYLGVLLRGIMQAHGLDKAEAFEYFAHKRGARGHLLRSTAPKV